MQGFYIFGDEKFLGNECYRIYKINSNSSYIHNDIENYYEGLSNTILTGSYNPNQFTTKRVIVIQMN